MKKIRLSLMAITAGIALFSLSSCMLHCVHGSGHQASEDRKVGGFSKISVSGGYKVILKQDSSFSIKITGDDNLLKYIKTKLEGDKLRIYNKKSFCNSGAVVVTIGVKNLEEIKGSGAVEITSNGTINVKDLNLDMSGATKITMDINAANVSTAGSGATEINLKGQASSYTIDISGVGHVHALDFVVGNCNIETSGAGDCEVNVLNNLHISSSGASDVKYRGHPTITNEKSGSSSVEPVN